MHLYFEILILNQVPAHGLCVVMIPSAQPFEIFVVGSLRIRLSIIIVKVFESISCSLKTLLSIVKVFLGDQIEFVIGQRLYWNREKSHRIIPEVLQILPKSTWATEVCNVDERTLNNAQV